MADCYRCGQNGHHRRDCPQDAPLPPAASGPAGPAAAAWCGECDERTRLIDCATSMTRCRSCHPLRGETLKQHARCGGCRCLVYTWDKAPCGKHQPLGNAVLRLVRSDP